MKIIKSIFVFFIFLTIAINIFSHINKIYAYVPPEECDTTADCPCGPPGVGQICQSHYCTTGTNPCPPTPTPQRPTPTSTSGGGATATLAPGQPTNTPAPGGESCQTTPPQYYDSGSCSTKDNCVAGGDTYDCVNIVNGVGTCRYFGLRGCPEGSSCPTDWRPKGWSCNAGCPWYHNTRSCNNGSLSDSGEQTGPCPGGTNVVQDFTKCEQGVTYANQCVQWTCAGSQGTANLAGWLLNQNEPPESEFGWQGWVRLMGDTGSAGSPGYGCDVTLFSTSPAYGGSGPLPSVNLIEPTEDAKILVIARRVISYDENNNPNDTVIEVDSGSRNINHGPFYITYYLSPIGGANPNCNLDQLQYLYNQSFYFSSSIPHSPECSNPTPALTSGLIELNYPIKFLNQTTGMYDKAAIQGLTHNWVYGKSSPGDKWGTGDPTLCIQAMIKCPKYNENGQQAGSDKIYSNELCFTRQMPTPTPTAYPTAVITGALYQRGGDVCYQASSTKYFPNPRIELNLSDSDCITPVCQPLPGTNATAYSCTVKFDNQGCNIAGKPAQSVQAGVNAVLSSVGIQNYPLVGAWFNNSMTCQSASPHITLSADTGGPINQNISFSYITKWIRLKNASFSARQPISNYLPIIINKFTSSDLDDDDSQRYFVIHSNQEAAGVVTNVLTNSYSYHNWYVESYTKNSSINPAYFLKYIKSRKGYRTIEAGDINKINEEGIYVVNGSGINLNLDKTIINNLPSKTVLIINGNLTISGDKFNIADNCSDTAGSKSIAFLSTNRISFSSTTQCAAGIFIAEDIDPGMTSDLGLKIKGNLIALSSFSKNREWADKSKPSYFIVFDPKFYIDLLPYISINLYDWREIAP